MQSHEAPVPISMQAAQPRLGIISVSSRDHPRPPSFGRGPASFPSGCSPSSFGGARALLGLVVAPAPLGLGLSPLGFVQTRPLLPLASDFFLRLPPRHSASASSLGPWPWLFSSVSYSLCLPSFPQRCSLPSLPRPCCLLLRASFRTPPRLPTMASQFHLAPELLLGHHHLFSLCMKPASASASAPTGLGLDSLLGLVRPRPWTYSPRPWLPQHSASNLQLPSSPQPQLLLGFRPAATNLPSASTLA